MTIFQFFVGMVILFLGIFKPLLYKPVAEKYLPKFSSVFVSFWMIAGILVTFPFMFKEFCFSVDVMKSNMFALGAAILKGWFVWGAVWSFQIINKKSTFEREGVFSGDVRLRKSSSICFSPLNFP